MGNHTCSAEGVVTHACNKVVEETCTYRNVVGKIHIYEEVVEEICSCTGLEGGTYIHMEVVVETHT